MHINRQVWRNSILLRIWNLEKSNIFGIAQYQSIFLAVYTIYRFFGLKKRSILFVLCTFAPLNNHFWRQSYLFDSTMVLQASDCCIVLVDVSIYVKHHFLKENNSLLVFRTASHFSQTLLCKFHSWKIIVLKRLLQKRYLVPGKF